MALCPGQCFGLLAEQDDLPLGADLLQEVENGNLPLRVAMHRYVVQQQWASLTGCSGKQAGHRHPQKQVNLLGRAVGEQGRIP